MTEQSRRPTRTNKPSRDDRVSLRRGEAHTPPDPPKPPSHLSENEGTYAVGYGNPPVHTRFRRGQSGNPRGRPKGAKNRLPALNEERLKSIILEEAYRTIRINDGGRQRQLSMAKAVVRSIAVGAAKGQARAQRLFTELVGHTERSNKATHDEWVNAAIEYKNGWEQVFQQCDAQGIARPAPLPHPDDIVVDPRSGQVHVKGPMTKEERVKWDEWRRLKKVCDDAIRQYEEDLRQPEYEPYRKFILDEIEHEKKMRAMISQIIKD